MDNQRLDDPDFKLRFTPREKEDPHIQLQISVVSECRPVFWKYPLYRNAQGNRKQSGTRYYKVNPQSNQERAFHSIYLTLWAALCPTTSKLSRVSGLTAKLLANPYG